MRPSSPRKANIEKSLTCESLEDLISQATEFPGTSLHRLYSFDDTHKVRVALKRSVKENRASWIRYLVVNVSFRHGGLHDVELDQGLENIRIEIVNAIFVDRTEKYTISRTNTAHLKRGVTNARQAFAVTILCILV